MTLTPEEPQPDRPTRADIEQWALEDEPQDEQQEEPPFDLGDLLAQAQDMQQQLLDAQAAVAGRVVEGQSGGGVVKVQVTGDLNFQAVVIDPSVVDPNDVEMLQDLVLAAIREATAKVNELNTEALGGFSGAMGGLLP